MVKGKQAYCETRTINVEGKEMDLIKFYDEDNYIIHNWDKAAVRDRSGSRVKKQYFLYGIEYSEEEFRDRVKDRTGLPWYKNPSLNLNARL
jgi:hypothetical protein|tara:strand:- start:913 stop:1185 length:273 start_codon:yes stop_codon:yes gene_type:complete